MQLRAVRPRTQATTAVRPMSSHHEELMRSTGQTDRETPEYRRCSWKYMHTIQSPMGKSAGKMIVAADFRPKEQLELLGRACPMMHLCGRSHSARQNTGNCGLCYSIARIAQ